MFGDEDVAVVATGQLADRREATSEGTSACGGQLAETSTPHEEAPPGLMSPIDGGAHEDSLGSVESLDAFLIHEEPDLWKIPEDTRKQLDSII